MSSSSVRGALAGALIFAAAIAVAVEPPPPGLHWQDLKEIRGRLLIPDGWSFKQVGSAEHLTYIVSPPEGKAVFTLTAEKHHKPDGVKAEALAFVETARDRASEATPVEELSMGVMQGFGSLLDFPATASDPGGSRIAITGIGNTRTGTLYMMRFDVPASEWESVWEKGRYLAGKFTLEDEE